MTDSSQKRPVSLRGPLLATALFCLAYGSVMALVLAPKGILISGPAVIEDSTIAAGTGQAATPDAVTQDIVKAGFTIAPLSAATVGVSNIKAD